MTEGELSPPLPQLVHQLQGKLIKQGAEGVSDSAEHEKIAMIITVWMCAANPFCSVFGKTSDHQRAIQEIIQTP